MKWTFIRHGKKVEQRYILTLSFIKLQVFYLTVELYY